MPADECIIELLTLCLCIWVRRGITPCLIGIVPYAGVDITMFEVAKEKLVASNGGHAPAPHLLLLTGMMSSSVAQTIAYPWGLIRTRLAVRAVPDEHSPLTDSEAAWAVSVPSQAC